MAWGDLAANRWISFTNIQTSGLTLRPGYGHVTSNEWMTKNDIETRYHVDAASLSGYVSNRWPPKSAVIETPTITCANSFTVSGQYVEIRTVAVGSASGTVPINYSVYNETGGAYSQYVIIEVQYEGGSWTTVYSATIPASGSVSGTANYTFTYNSSNLIKIRVTKSTNYS